MAGDPNSLPDPQCALDSKARLASFEAHASPFLSAKIEALKNATARPDARDIVVVEVPVPTIATELWALYRDPDRDDPYVRHTSVIKGDELRALVAEALALRDED